MSSQSEEWYFVKDGNVYYHYENDGYQAMRRGLQATDKLLGTVEEMKEKIDVDISRFAKEEYKYRSNVKIIKAILEYEEKLKKN